MKALEIQRRAGTSLRKQVTQGRRGKDMYFIPVPELTMPRGFKYLDFASL